ncbi:bleomycin resistance protein [Croceicoccus estronivorus]|nr:bleomycin resistance protein [Croceicoccus estronivorus]
MRADLGLEVGLVSNDIEGQTRFYSETLGLPVEGNVEIPQVGRITRFRAGGSVLRVLVPLTPAAGASREGGFAGTEGIRYIALKVSNLAELVQRVTDAGFNVVIPIRTLRPGVDVALVEDSDGNTIELMEEHAS